MHFGLVSGLSLLAAGLHPNSESASRIDVMLDGVRVTTHLQALSLVEVLPDLDADGDGIVTAAEVAAGASGIRDYVALHQVLGLPSGDSIPLTFVAVNWLEHDELNMSALGVEVVRFAPWSRIPDQLEYGMDFFFDTSPAHFEQLWVFFHDGLPTRGFLDSRAPTTTLVRPRSLRRTCATEGLRAGGQGALVLLMIGLLMAGDRRRRDGILFAGCAMTGAWAGVLGWTDVEPRILSLAMAMGATYLALDRYLQNDDRGRAVESVLFGLLAGTTASAFLDTAVPGAFGRDATLVFAAAALVPGFLVAALAHSFGVTGPRSTLVLAGLSGALFLCRTLGWFPHGL